MIVCACGGCGILFGTQRNRGGSLLYSFRFARIHVYESYSCSIKVLFFFPPNIFQSSAPLVSCPLPSNNASLQ